MEGDSAVPSNPRHSTGVTGSMAGQKKGSFWELDGSWGRCGRKIHPVDGYPVKWPLAGIPNWPKMGHPGRSWRGTAGVVLLVPPVQIPSQLLSREMCFAGTRSMWGCLGVILCGGRRVNLCALSSALVRSFRLVFLW